MLPKRKAASNGMHTAPKKRRRTTGEKVIDSANELPITDFGEQYVENKWLSYQPSPSTVQPDEDLILDVSLKSASELTNEEFNACFNLVKTTSQHDYENSSFGWHVKRKKREMRESEMRYLLVRRRRRSEGDDQRNPADQVTEQPSKTAHTHNANASAEEGDWIDDDDDDGEVEAFLSFMLTHDSSPPVPVLYIYEIHIASSLRSCGLGSHLMTAAEHIASKVGVRMVMLTCFLSNVKARSFYERRGYAKDVCSPEDRKTRERVVEVDYVIMSKRV